MKLPADHLPYPPHVLKRIANLRRQNHLSQRQVAAVLGVTQQTYSEYERGVSRMHIEELIRLAKLYNVSIDFITGASNLKEKYPKY